MKPLNTLVPQTKDKEKKELTFSAAITGADLQGLIRKAVSTPESAARLTATLISAVAASPKLQNCDPANVVAAALRGEGEGLVYEREYSIVPFGQSAAYVRGWRGYLSLLYATGEIADTDCFEVRDGEIIGRDKRKKRLIFDFAKYETDEEAYKHPIVGYYCYVEYLSGRFVYDYMSVDEILHHADRYVPYFSLALYNKWKSGAELTPDEFRKFGIPYSTLVRLHETGEGTDAERKAEKDLGAWYNEGASQIAMMKKTVILKLLRSGRVRLANTAVMRSMLAENEEESGDIFTVDSKTGELLPAPATNELELSTPQETMDGAESDETNNEENSPPEQKTKRRGRPPKAETQKDEPVQPEAKYEDDAIASFFGETDGASV